MEQIETKRGGFNGNHLKLIAILAMTVDHAADLLFVGFPIQPIPIVLHLIGRLTAPMMWFFVVEGFYYTKDLKRYMGRMLLFAILSHFAYCFAFGIDCLPLRSGIFNQTSVIWPLFWALVALWIFHRNTTWKHWQKILALVAILIITFPADWSCIAVMAILMMYDQRGNPKKQWLVMAFWVLIYATVSFFCVSRAYGLVQLGVLLVYPFWRRYNGERGKARWLKWFFYVYYPAHLILVGILRLLLYGNVPLLF